MKSKIYTLLLSTCLVASFSGSALASPAPTPADSTVGLYSPGPGFPLADGIDVLASSGAKVEKAVVNGNFTTLSTQSYSSPGFTTGVYVGGSKPTIFSLNSKGYAEFSSVYQQNVNPGESVQVTYQTLDANNGSVLAGKNLSGIQSSASVVLTTKVQKNTAVNAYLGNFTGHKTSASGVFNY
ncbi:hypothetical protein ACE6ED_22355 [Paenibacillus sp. CN-4]|uniref:hypothetical protein n=1 Tax=Paenibacillus nanchangensis TaxID=3348343 RepID=UPI003979DCA7